MNQPWGSIAVGAGSPRETRVGHDLGGAGLAADRDARESGAPAGALLVDHGPHARSRTAARVSGRSPRSSADGASARARPPMAFTRCGLHQAAAVRDERRPRGPSAAASP